MNSLTIWVFVLCCLSVLLWIIILVSPYLLKFSITRPPEAWLNGKGMRAASPNVCAKHKTLSDCQKDSGCVPILNETGNFTLCDSFCAEKTRQKSKVECEGTVSEGPYGCKWISNPKPSPSENGSCVFDTNFVVPELSGTSEVGVWSKCMKISVSGTSCGTTKTSGKGSCGSSMRVLQASSLIAATLQVSVLVFYAIILRSMRNEKSSKHILGQISIAFMTLVIVLSISGISSINSLRSNHCGDLLTGNSTTASKNGKLYYSSWFLFVVTFLSVILLILIVVSKKWYI